MTTPLDKVIELIGSQKVLADTLGITQQTVSLWRHKRNGVVPAEYVIPMEKAVQGKVNRYEIRPDIYPKDDCPCRSRRRKQ